MLKLTTLLFLLSFICNFARATDSSDIEITWELENYNGWNLPFGMTVRLENSDPDQTEKLTQGDYKLEVDPSAYFSVLFQPDFVV